MKHRLLNLLGLMSLGLLLLVMAVWLRSHFVESRLSHASQRLERGRYRYRCVDAHVSRGSVLVNLSRVDFDLSARDTSATDVADLPDMRSAGTPMGLSWRTWRQTRDLANRSWDPWRWRVAGFAWKRDVSHPFVDDPSQATLDNAALLVPAWALAAGAAAVPLLRFWRRLPWIGRRRVRLGLPSASGFDVASARGPRLECGTPAAARVEA